MATTRSATRTDFWEFLHAALGLQQTASKLALGGELEESALYERQALGLLLEATCQLEQDEPALPFVRMLATAGIARLHKLTRTPGPAQRPARAIGARLRRQKAVVA